MRYLSSYLPENLKDGDDCTPFVCKALAEGTGTLYIEPGGDRFNETIIPDNMILKGSGPGTIIKSAAVMLFSNNMIKRIGLFAT